MSHASIGLTPLLQNYLRANNRPEHPVMAKCRAEAERVGTTLQIGAEQGAFMSFLAELIGARRTIEIGVYTGYSSMAVGRALKAMHGSDARLVGFDISKEYTDQARANWREMGIDDIVELVLGPAMDGLDARLAAGEAGSYDMAFIDADKTGYAGYHERCLKLLRPGGLILFDNALWRGEVADPVFVEPDTVALRALNAAMVTDKRVSASLIAVGDGLLMCTKK